MVDAGWCVGMNQAIEAWTGDLISDGIVVAGSCCKDQDPVLKAAVV